MLPYADDSADADYGRRFTFRFAFVSLRLPLPLMPPPISFAPPMLFTLLSLRRAPAFSDFAALFAHASLSIFRLPSSDYFRRCLR